METCFAWLSQMFMNFQLTPMVIESEKRGAVKLALQYVPEPVSGKNLGEVHIYLMECIGLPCLQGKQLNSLVKCIFLPDRKSGQKTKPVGGENNDVSVHHTFICDGFFPDDLTEVCAELTVWDHRIFRNKFLGGLRLGSGKGKSFGIDVNWMDSTPAEISLWESMIKSPNTWVIDILPLRISSPRQRG
ncbi:synaptotagmin-like protein 2 [Macrotis lagotis]|uniref:synaptotagmin-like protein 2 n=1 Tax=Macrotis lagotis TaxID=92651 RepID=UPI003D687E5D